MEPFRKLIGESEDWLMNRILEYSRQTGYSAYASTLREGWRLSIEGLSGSLIQALNSCDHPPHLHPDEDYKSDPIAAFGMHEARLHRNRGISIIQFIGLMNYYKQSYVDLIYSAGFPETDEKKYIRFTELFYNRMELGFISEWIDLSDNDRMRELTNQLDQSNVTKDLIFSIIGHDLRSPFNSILGFVNLLTEEWEDFTETERRDFIKNIKTSAENAFNLLQNLIEWIRLQQGKISFYPKNLSVNPIVKEVIELMKPSAAQKSISLTSAIPGEIMARGDENMFRTVIRNLVSNAIKFTNHHGGISIEASEKNDFVELSVHDNGIGMDEKNLKQLFTMHETRTSPGTANEKGCGLGLLICKELVEINHGKIQARSQPGVGSTFVISFPLSK